MIPVLGVPFLNRPDLLSVMLRSVDAPVQRTIIVDNSVRGFGLQGEPNRTVITPGHNLGVAASWNLIIKASPDAGWWVIANSDIEFAPGSLDKATAAIGDEPGTFWMFAGMTAFAVSAEVLELVGWFDENFVPAYFEDNDYARRCLLAGVPIRDLPDAAPKHRGSSTIRSDTWINSENGRTFPENQRFYRAKWGGGPGEEVFTTPFNRGGDIRSCTLPFSRLRHQTWRLK